MTSQFQYLIVMTKQGQKEIAGQIDSVQAAEIRLKKQFNSQLGQKSTQNTLPPDFINKEQNQELSRKYRSMNKYVRLTKQDMLNKYHEQARFLGTVVLGLAGGYLAAKAITTLLTRPGFWRINSVHRWNPWIYSTLMTSGVAYQYMQAQERYRKNVCLHIVRRYLPQAIQNGFEDYQIPR